MLQLIQHYFLMIRNFNVTGKPVFSWSMLGHQTNRYVILKKELVSFISICHSKMGNIKFIITVC